MSTISLRLSRYGNFTTSDGYVFQERLNGATIVWKELPGGQVRDLDFADIALVSREYVGIPTNWGSEGGSKDLVPKVAFRLAERYLVAYVSDEVGIRGW